MRLHLQERVCREAMWLRSCYGCRRRSKPGTEMPDTSRLPRHAPLARCRERICPRTDNPPPPAEAGAASDTNSTRSWRGTDVLRRKNDGSLRDLGESGVLDGVRGVRALLCIALGLSIRCCLRNGRGPSESQVLVSFVLSHARRRVWPRIPPSPPPLILPALDMLHMQS